MKKLKNTDIETLYKNVSSYKEDIVDETFDFYKTIQAFINSNSMKGLAGESVFNYYGQVHFYLINKIMNIAEEITEETDAIMKEYLEYETSPDGLVNTDFVNEKKRAIRDIRNEFDDHNQTLATMNREISHIAGVEPVSGQAVLGEFDNTNSVMDQVVEDLESKDQRLTNKLSSLESRVSELKSAIIDIENNYKTGGAFSSNKVESITSAAWYSEEEIDTFQNKFDESPFFIRDVEESSYTTEVGAETDFGTHRFSASANTRGYGYEIDGDDFSAYADYTGFEGRGHFESKYAESEINVRAGYGSVEVNNKGPLGRVEGEAGVARVEADTTLGWDDWNVHADGEAGVLTADGYARADTGGIGFKGNASLAHASAKGGFTLWGTDIDLGVSAGKVGGGIDIGWDHIEIELNILAGASLSIDFPW